MAAAAAPVQWSLAALETLMAEDQMDQHAAVLRAFSVVELWRLRRVCRAFHRWGTAALAALPRPAVMGGRREAGADLAGSGSVTAGVEVLDLSTLRWSSGVVPALPEPCDGHAACCNSDGRVVVVGGRGFGQAQTALQWVRGAAGWAPLPDLAAARRAPVAVALSDGRAMVVGGYTTGTGTLASVEVLAADGSGWSELTPMGTARYGARAAALPCGKVLVTGGMGRGSLNTAELWDPATRAWSDLPPLAEQRFLAGCCVLPSGRVAVVGGRLRAVFARMGGTNTAEAFDPEARTWQPLPPMNHTRNGHGVVAVAGGLLAVGGARADDEGIMPPDELFDEASGRWFELPELMAEPRESCCVVSLPAAALAPPAAAAAAAAAQ
eukprot:COSAG04_NODE_271_length_18505_cov_15.097957_2_plen_381_part_00